MNAKALEGLGRVLILSDPKDIKLLEMKAVPGMPKSKSRREAIADILDNAESPGKLLRQQTIKKTILNEYLKEIGVPDPKDLTKDDCIRSCLKKWGVEDDSMKYRNEGEIRGALNRLEAEREKKIEKIISQYENKKKPLLDSLREIRKRNLDSTSPDAYSTDGSPSSSTKFSFPEANTPKVSLKKRKNDIPDDEISIVMEKRAKSSVSDIKVENICVTPDIKPETSAEGHGPTTPDSSDTSTVFWVNW